MNPYQPGEDNQDPYEVGYKAGTASRDAEVARLETRLEEKTAECQSFYEEAERVIKQRDQLREQVAALQRSIDFDQIQAQQETIDKLRNDVEMLRGTLDDKQWKKDGDVHAHNKRVQEALAATEQRQ